MSIHTGDDIHGQALINPSPFPGVLCSVSISEPGYPNRDLLRSSAVPLRRTRILLAIASPAAK